MSTGAIAFHDTIAAEFAQRYETSAAFLERFQVWTQLFVQYVKPTDRVLDLGCGSGIFSHYLAGRAGEVTGIDGSAAMITLCQQKKTAVNVRYVLETIPLPEPDRYFSQDVIIMSSLLEYLDDVTATLDQVQHLLKPNGLFIVSLPNQLSIYRRAERLAFRLFGRPRYAAYIRNTATGRVFSHQLATFGFEFVDLVYFSSYDPVSRLLKPFLDPRYVNTLFVGVYRKMG